MSNDRLEPNERSEYSRCWRAPNGSCRVRTAFVAATRCEERSIVLGSMRCCDHVIGHRQIAYVPNALLLWGAEVTDPKIIGSINGCLCLLTLSRRGWFSLGFTRQPLVPFCHMMFDCSVCAFVMWPSNLADLGSIAAPPTGRARSLCLILAAIRLFPNSPLNRYRQVWF